MFLGLWLTTAYTQSRELYERFTNQDVQEIDDTVGIMRDNINKVAERGERLTSIQDKADNLAVSAQGFKRGANRVRKQMWWKDLKMRLCLLLVIVILLIVIIVPIAVHFS